MHTTIKSVIFNMALFSMAGSAVVMADEQSGEHRTMTQEQIQEKVNKALSEAEFGLEVQEKARARVEKMEGNSLTREESGLRAEYGATVREKMQSQNFSRPETMSRPTTMARPNMTGSGRPNFR